MEGAANLAACRFLAALLRIPRSRVALEGGEAARDKRIRLRDMTLVEAKVRLGIAAADVS